MRETYARVTMPISPTVDAYVGLELRNGLEYESLRALLRYELVELTSTLEITSNFDLRVWGWVKAITWLLEKRWPDRAFFLEVGNDHDWVQVYDPRGFVKERCPCARPHQPHDVP